MPRQRPQRGQSDDGDGERWLGTYGDMVTLLMAFFVLLYAISQVDESKFISLLRGLDVFGNTTNVDGLLESGPALLDETSSGKPDSGDQVGELSLEPKAAPQETQGEPTEDVQPTPPVAQDDVREVTRKLKDALRSVGLEASITDVRPDPRGVVISVSSDDVLFDLGSSTLTKTGARVVSAIAKVVAQYDEDIVIEGHTDNLPLRRGRYTNWNLSTDRAVAVVHRLHDRHGIDQKRLVAVGYSEFRPLRPNTTAANRARNRRVDVLLRLTGESRDVR